MISKNGHHTAIDGLQTTHSELIKKWKKCGSYLHIPKPFGESYDSHIEKQRKRYTDSISTLRNYSEYFKKLLWNHAAIGLEYSTSDDLLNALEPGKPQNAWIVNFGKYESDDISIALAVSENS
jgi:hypothetical protein